MNLPELYVPRAVLGDRSVGVKHSSGVVERWGAYRIMDIWDKSETGLSRLILVFLQDD